MMKKWLDHVQFVTSEALSTFIMRTHQSHDTTNKEGGGEDSEDEEEEDDESDEEEILVKGKSKKKRKKRRRKSKGVTKTQLKSQMKLIPDLIFQNEQFDLNIIKLIKSIEKMEKGSKCGIGVADEFKKYIKRTIVRDFKFNLGK